MVIPLFSSNYQFHRRECNLRTRFSRNPGTKMHYLLGQIEMEKVDEPIVTHLSVESHLRCPGVCGWNSIDEKQSGGDSYIRFFSFFSSVSFATSSRNSIPFNPHFSRVFNILVSINFLPISVILSTIFSNLLSTTSYFSSHLFISSPVIFYFIHIFFILNFFIHFVLNFTWREKYMNCIIIIFISKFFCVFNNW